jgi:hypothetical protein
MKRTSRTTYTSADVEQHTKLSLHLQRTNARASHLLLRLARLRPSNPQFKSLCTELASVAELLILDISFCEGIANNHIAQSIQRIIVTLHTTCAFCEENPLLNSSKKHDEHFGPLTTSPTWADQLNSLTWLMTRIRQDIVGNSPSPARETKKLIRCLNELYTAIQRQRRHLERIAAHKRPEIEVRFDPCEVCPGCGQKYEPGPLDDDDTSEDKT